MNSDRHRAANFCNVPIREWQETAPSANFDARMTSKNHPDDACFDRAGLQRLGIRRIGFCRYSGGSFVPRHSAEFSSVSSRWLAVSAAMPWRRPASIFHPLSRLRRERPARNLSPTMMHMFILPLSMAFAALQPLPPDGALHSTFPLTALSAVPALSRNCLITTRGRAAATIVAAS